MLKTFELSFKPRPLGAGVFDKGCSPLDNRVQTEWVGTEWEEVNGEEYVKDMTKHGSDFG